MSSTQQMQVQMEDCLARVRTHVVDGAKAMLQLAFARYLGRNQLAIANKFGVGLRGLVNAHDMLFGDDQNVRRRAGFDVLEDINLLVFVYLLRGNFSGDDLAEEAISHNSLHINKVRSCVVFLKFRAKRATPTFGAKTSRANLDFLSSGNLYPILLAFKMPVAIGISPFGKLRVETSEKSIQPHQKHRGFGMRFPHDFLSALFVVVGHADAEPVAAHGAAELQHLGGAIAAGDLFLQL